MKLWQKITSALLALTTIIIIWSSGGEKKDEELPELTEIINMFEDNTYIDDILSNEDTVSVTEGGKEKEKQVLEATSKLETYLNLVDEIEELEITRMADMPEERLTPEDIELLVESYKNGEFIGSEKRTVEATLMAYCQKYKSWITQNGLAIIEESLKRSIKGFICTGVGSDGEDYETWIISSKPTNPKEYTDSSISSDDYGTLYPSTNIFSDNQVYTAMEWLWGVQTHEDSTDYDQIRELCAGSLKIIKILIASTPEVKNDKISAEETTKEATQKILKMTNSQN